MVYPNLLLLLAQSCLASSALHSTSHSHQKRASSVYAPVKGDCPSDSLVRQGHTISPEEQTYLAGRLAKTGPALASWLQKTGFSNVNASHMPIVGFATSGGGFKSMLTSAGVHKAFDGREGSESTSGLLQGIAYESGLSGGSWLLTALAGNNYPTISTLQDFWQQQLPNPFPGGLDLIDSTLGKGFVDDMTAKKAAGFDPTLVDAYGQLLSPLLLAGPNSGLGESWSGITSMSNFTSFDMPFPMVTSIGVNPFSTNMCSAYPNATQFEMTPYEFGSWDAGVDAFIRMQYLGTSMSNGEPTDSSSCITGYDRMAYIAATSGNIFGPNCQTTSINIPSKEKRTFDEIFGPMSQLWSAATGAVTGGLFSAQTAQTDKTDFYGVYPNPFEGYTTSSLLNARPELTLLDGAVSGQNDPIWPHINRNVSVLIISDNGSGLALYNTYLRAVAANLTRMPAVPSDPSYYGFEYTSKPRFFGCSDKSKMTIVAIPNYDYTFKSVFRDVLQWQYTSEEVAGMISNGALVGSNNGNDAWATCLGCAILDKDSSGLSLPVECNDCFAEHCVGTWAKSNGVSQTASPTDSPTDLPTGSSEILQTNYPDMTIPSGSLTPDGATTPSAGAPASSSSTGAASSLIRTGSGPGAGIVQIGALAAALSVGSGVFGLMIR